MKKLFTPALAAIALGLSLTSCLSDGENTVTGRDIYADCFNVIVDRQTGDISYGAKPQYELNWKQDGSRELVTLKFSNLSIPDLADYTYTFPEAAVNVTSSDNQIILANVTPTNMSSVTFTNLRVSYVRRVVRDPSSSNQMFNRYVYAINYTVNNRYDVTVYPNRAYCFSKTNTVNLSDPTKTYSADDYNFAPTYVMTFSPITQKCSLSISQAKFIEGMPAMNMVFDDIAFTPTATSGLMLSASQLVPKIGGDPFPGFPITNLTGGFKPLTQSSLQFECTPMTVDQGQTTFKVTVTLDEVPRTQANPS